MSEKLPVLDRVPPFLGYEPHDTFGQTPAFIKEGPSTIRTLFTAPADWAGLGRILHGGFQGLLLDDIMWRVIRGLTHERPAVSKGLTLRYHRPVHVNTPFCIFGYLIEDGDQEIATYGEIKDTDGNLLTEAEGIFVQPEPENPQAETAENTPRSPLPEFASVRHWPPWSACCRGPLERLCDLHVDWRLASDRSALGGFLCFPSALRHMPSAGILAALFDQTLGLLGSLQGHGVILTVRLQLTTYCLLPVEEELVLLSRGHRQLNGPFKARAWLQHKNCIVGEASGSFSVLSQRHEG